MTFNDQLIEILPRLRAYAIMLTRDRSAADDVVQEAAMRALSSQAQFQVGTNFSAWMHRIVRNTFINAWRIKQRTPVSVDAMTTELYATNTSAEDLVLLRELSTAMEGLPRPQQEALILVCASGLSYEEAAAVQNCAVGTLKSRLFRAKAYLADVVGYDAPSAARDHAHEQDRDAISAASKGDDDKKAPRKIGVPTIPLDAPRRTARRESDGRVR